jgi:excisionase family DNA binding protein
VVSIDHQYLTLTGTSYKLLIDVCSEIGGDKMNMGNKTRSVLNIEELSEYLDIPKSTLYKLAREGRVPSQKIGRQWRFHKGTIDKWLSENMPNRERSG